MITVVSPDKISLSMYTEFLMRSLGGGYHTGYCHFLMTPENLDSYLNEFRVTYEKSLLRYFADRKFKEPEGAVPSRLIADSSAVVWFPLYGTDAIIVKDEGGIIAALQDKWKEAVARLGGA